MGGYSQKGSVGLIFQNSFGTPGTPGLSIFIPKLSETLGLNIPPLYSENLSGIFDEGDSYEGPKTIDGGIECEAEPIPLGGMLACVLEPTSVVNSGGIYTHTFKPRTADWDETSAGIPVTAMVDRNVGSYMLYSDLNGDVLELGIANGELLKAKVDFVGGTFSENIGFPAIYSRGKRWTWDQSSVSLDGAGISSVKNLVITLTEGIEAQHTLNGSKYPSCTKRSNMRTIAIAGTLKFDNQDEYLEFVNQSERALILNFKGVTEIQSGYYETLKLELPKMRYEEAKPTMEGPGQIEMAVTARGKYHVGSGTSFQATLVNTRSSYI